MRKGERHFGDEIIGFRDSWDGVMERRTIPLTGDRTGFEIRPVLRGHVRRGGTPTAFDRLLSTRFGVAAIEAVHREAWGQIVALRADRVVDTPLSNVAGRTRSVDISLFDDVAEVFFA